MNKDMIWRGVAILAVIGLILIALISLMALILTSKPTLVSTDCVGVLTIDGPIDLKSVRSGFRYIPGAEDYADAIRKASKDPRIKGLFVIINSPGGGVVASDIIYRELKRFNKPKISYIEEIGASGGYYIALGTSKIYAHQNSLVGSIGVIFYLSDYKELLEKIGVNITVVKSGPNKDMGSPFRYRDELELEIIKDIVNETYNQFKEILLESRYILEEDIDKVTDGRIFTGSMAKRLGLIDDIGLKNDFLNKFIEELGLPQGSICDITPNQQIPSIFSLYGMLSTLHQLIITDYGYRYRLRAE